tara:strand:- start:429 stop:761 length:333 start_codon:yes stop_codon:yes gene_type:complete
MTNLATKIKLYAEANSISNLDFKKDVIVKDFSDGTGAKITEWNIDSLAQPTSEQLDTYNSAATTEENNNAIRATRKSAYGNIGDQLDEIFKDIDAWKARIKSIKDANPKE